MSKRCCRVLLVFAIPVVALAIIYLVCFFTLHLAYPRGYSVYVEKYASAFSVPSHVVYSVIKVESGFDSSAVSDKGACGLMQLMPSTYEWLVQSEDWAVGDIFDPEENIKCGTYYLSLLYKKYGNWTYALCAYNAGMGNVDKWLAEEKFTIPFEETKKYVNKLDVAIDRYRRLCYG